MNAPQPHKGSLRVALVNDVGGLGGIEIMLLTLARHLPRDRFLPVYFAPEPGPMADEMRALGVEVILVRRSSWWSTSFYFAKHKLLNPLALLYDVTLLPATSLPLARALRAARIDVVHSAGMVSQVVGGFAARLARIPHVAQVGDIVGQPSIRWLYQRLLERVADRIVGVSRAVAEGCDPKRTSVIPNAVDLDRWQGTADVREQLGIGAEEKMIGIVGRLTPWKGQQVFLSAAKRMLTADQPPGRPQRYQFVLVGDDSVGRVSGYRAELEQFAAQEPLRGRVQFLGRRSDVLDVMAACDVLVHASTKPEPFGLVIIEGMAVGTPTIATALGGPLDIIRDRVDGMLVPPGDAEALADAVRSLCDHPDEARRMAERARHKSRTVYSAAAMTEQFARLYSEVAARRKESSAGIDRYARSTNLSVG